MTSIGPAAARQLRFAAVGEPGKVTPADATIAAILPEQRARFDLYIPMEASRAGGLRLHAWWQDETGEREADLTDIPRGG